MLTCPGEKRALYIYWICVYFLFTISSGRARTWIWIHSRLREQAFLNIRDTLAFFYADVY